jgi:hypothetical protein
MAITNLSTSSLVSGVKRRRVWDQTATTDGFFQIATTTLNVAASSITFSSIPQDYTHLQLRSFSQDARGTYGITETRITFNSDSSAVYARHQLVGDGSTVFSDGATGGQYMILGDGTFGTTTGGTFGVGIADILDYTNTNKFKTVRQISGVDINGTIAGYGGRAGLSSGVWRSTSAISSITLTSHSVVNFSANSSFALYGVKA